jgi:RHS repeat-associated protein
LPASCSAVALPFNSYVDHLNTPRLVANQSGQTVWRWDQQEPFGVNPADENPSGLGAFDLPLRLPGQYFDKETNLHYNYFRDYDPAIGRYIQSDPIGLLGGINTYSYALNDPLVLLDATGLRVELNGYVLNNAYVISNLSALNQAIVDQGIPDDCFILSVTGGDRYRDRSGRHRSVTNNQVVSKSDPNSPHLVERGARAVDLKIINVTTGRCMCVPRVDSTIFDVALGKTDFSPRATIRNYSDGHTHINLPPLPRFINYPAVNP